MIKDHPERSQNINYIVQFIERSGGIQYALQTMQRKVEEGMALLSSFPEGDAQQSLRDLLTFAANRDH